MSMHVDGLAATAWIADRLPVSDTKILTDRPWARTLRITAQDRQYYLKTVSRQSDRRLGYLSSLSEIGGEVVPQVVAQDLEQNHVLFADFRAEVFQGRLSAPDKTAALTAYGALQRRCADQHAALSDIPERSAVQILDRFLALMAMAADGDDGGSAPGNPFATFSRGSISDYRRLFGALAAPLRRIVAASAALRATINHCDLRPKNIARRADGQIVLFDWDDAVWAPPGLSLHAQFSGCSRVLAALSPETAWASSTEAEDRRVLVAYKAALTEGGTIAAPGTDIDAALRGSAIAGMMNYISSFAPYPQNDDAVRKSIKATVRGRISDLMDGLEALSLQDQELHAALLSAYRATGRDARAARLSAEDARRAANAQVLGADAPFFFDGAAHAADPEGFTRRAADAFRDNGVLVLRDLFPTELVAECRRHFFDGIEDIESDIAGKKALRVGDKRYMVSLDIAGPFAEESLLAAPPLLSVLKDLLSREVVLGSFTAVASAPGARDQGIHRDNPPLFSEASRMDMPSFCIAVIIPLIDLDARSGTTRVWPGSHKLSSNSYDQVRPVDPYLKAGGCYLMDSRLFHQGLANTGDTVRPILSLVYQRPWYRDHRNFNNQEPVRIAPETRASLSAPVADLLKWMPTA